MLSIVPGVTGLSNPGPTISHVVASQGVLTWNAVDSGGVESSGLTVDGAAVTTVEGPYAAPTGLNYAWPYGNSSAAGISLASGTHSYVITATGNDGNASQYAGTFTVGSDTGPTISEVVVSAAQGVITWNARAAYGVASSSITIDGAAVKNVYGPYTAPPGVNYSGAFGAIASGSHTYVITATDDTGNSWQYTGSFVAGNADPAISKVVVSAEQGVITWNARATDGVASSSITIDGAAVKNVYGPYTAPPGVNYSGAFGAIASGSHTYVITATDDAGHSSQSVGLFTVAGPTISEVDVSVAQGVITWNARATDGVASSSITIDGAAVKNVYGPYTAPPGVNYAGAFNALSSGAHTYIITATDDYGHSSQFAGTFTVAGPTISEVDVSVAQGVITWNVAAAYGVASSSLTIDGAAVTNFFGPYTAPPGVNYSGTFSALSVGSHTYAITATDNAGNSAQHTGTFVVGPMISQVMVSVTQGTITWNVAAAYGVASSSLTIDGAAVTNLFGPYTAPPGVNYSGTFSTLSAGSHTYAITATDDAGNSTQRTGTFVVGPMISQVVVSVTQGTITWNVAAAYGVAGSSLTIDGAAVDKVDGPYTAPPGVNYAAVYGVLQAGEHSYTITAIDDAGNSTQYVGTFTA